MPFQIGNTSGDGRSNGAGVGGGSGVGSNYHYYDDDLLFPLDGSMGRPEVDPANLNFTLDNLDKSTLWNLTGITDYDMVISLSNQLGTQWHCRRDS